MITCSQKGGGGCKDQAAYRYTWPGQDEAYACEAHAQQLAGIALHMGMHLQLIPLPLQDQPTPTTPAKE